MPRGLLYGPFHPEHEEIPPDASQEYVFECSDALHSCLREFYQTICPLLTPIPSLENIDMLCAMYTEHICSARINAVDVLLAFEQRLRRGIFEAKRRLPGKDPKHVALKRGLDEDIRLARQLSDADILSMKGVFIALKVWMCLFTRLDRYIVRYNAFLPELIRLHEQLDPWCFLTINFSSTKSKISTSGPRVHEKHAHEDSLPTVKSCAVASGVFFRSGLNLASHPGLGLTNRRNGRNCGS
ncbi:hypothetical protein B0H16DRAFT_1782445 [Mycena metata]|uniref:Uncharacterized protein n=1 Tax=Mycena metata TaxID=1033252 RepID=A0AAD7HPD7_9AGAR|nr:hypothetical protein B0H16DRAFT_1782445 [Mycena metata]